MGQTRRGRTRALSYSAMSPLRIPPTFWGREDVTTALRDRDFQTLFQLLRRWAGASQTRIGAACEMAQGVVSRIANGRQVPRDIAVIERIATGLDMPDHARLLLRLAPRSPQAIEPAPKEHVDPGGP